MERLELNVERREIGKGPSRQLRRSERIPAVLYGKGHETVPLSVGAKDLDRVLDTDAGWNILLDLNVDGKDKILARIADYQADVLRRNLTHVDFQVLDLTQKIRTDVPIKLVGTPAGVKEGGILETIKRTIEVRCLPTNIPEHIELDVSGLGIGQNIHIKDIPVPKDVEFVYETNFSIASIVAPTEELVYEAPEAVVEGEVAPVLEGEVAAAAPEAEGEEKGKPTAAKTPEKGAPKGGEGEKKE